MGNGYSSPCVERWWRCSGRPPNSPSDELGLPTPSAVVGQVATLVVDHLVDMGAWWGAYVAGGGTDVQGPAVVQLVEGEQGLKPLVTPHMVVVRVVVPEDASTFVVWVLGQGPEQEQAQLLVEWCAGSVGTSYTLG